MEYKLDKTISRTRIENVFERREICFAGEYDWMTMMEDMLQVDLFEHGKNRIVLKRGEKA